MVTLEDDFTNTGGFWDKFRETAELNRLFLMPVLLMVTTLLGGLSAGFGAGSSVLELALVMFPTMAVITTCMAVLPMRYVIGAVAFSLAMDLLVMVI